MTEEEKFLKKTQRALPFRINRDDARTLVQQVTDGLRLAIVSGKYAPGDVLPSSRDLGPLLGVSRIVTSAALSKLTSEGYVTSRPRLGCVVRDRGEKLWNGRVLVVCPEGDDNYFQNILIGVLRNRLAGIGYLLLVATVPLKKDGHYDFADLDAALSVSVDLALVVFARNEICRYLARGKVPYAVFGEITKPPRGAVGFVRYDYTKPIPAFVEACKRANVTKVVQVGWHRLMCDAVPALRAANVEAVRERLDPEFGEGRIVGVRRAGMDYFLSLLKKGRLVRDAVYFFNDDNLTQGALAALAYYGKRSPDDVRIVTWANCEIGPVYPVPFSRMELDEVNAGRILAEAVVEYLRKGTFPKGVSVGAEWRDGATLDGR